jgi:hypothetical protein
MFMESGRVETGFDMPRYRQAHQKMKSILTICWRGRHFFIKNTAPQASLWVITAYLTNT